MSTFIRATIITTALLSASALVHASSWGDALRDKLSSTTSTEKATSTSTPAASSALGSLLGGGGGDSSATASILSSMGFSTSSTASNAAGVLSYCVKNNLLKVDSAAAIKDQLLSKIGISTPAQQKTSKDQGYLSGLAGMITGSDGQSFSMDKLKGDLKEKACDLVLDNAKSLL